MKPYMIGLALLVVLQMGLAFEYTIWSSTDCSGPRNVTFALNNSEIECQPWIGGEFIILTSICVTGTPMTAMSFNDSACTGLVDDNITLPTPSTTCEHFGPGSAIANCSSPASPISPSSGPFAPPFAASPTGDAALILPVEKLLIVCSSLILSLAVLV